MAQPKLVSGGELCRMVLASPKQLALGALACAVLAAIVPVATVSGGFVGTPSLPLQANGVMLAGWLAWVVVAAFATAAASRFVAEVGRYRTLLDLAALTMLVGTVIWSLVGGPVATSLAQINEMRKTIAGSTADAYRTINESRTMIDQALRQVWLTQNELRNGPVKTPIPPPQPVPLARLPTLDPMPMRPDAGLLFVILAPVALLLARKADSAEVLPITS